MRQRLGWELPRRELGPQTGEHTAPLARHKVGTDYCGKQNDAHRRPQADSPTNRDEQTYLDRWNKNKSQKQNGTGSHES